MKKTKKILAMAMATAMVMSSSVMAFAADYTVDPATGEAAGAGDIEGIVDKDVFTVTLPTATTLHFVIDPQELMLAAATGAKPQIEDKVGGTPADAAAGYGADVLFKDNANYSTKSADLTIVNKSTFDVDVNVTASVVTTSTAVTVVDTVTNDAVSAISMKLTPTKGTIKGDNSSAVAGDALTGTALSTTDVTSTNTIAVAADVDDAYKVTGSNHNYSYNIDASAAAGVDFNTITYNLSGKVNQKGDWKAFYEDVTTKGATLSVKVAYEVTKHVDGPSVTMSNSGLISIKGLTATQNFVGMSLSDGVGNDFDIAQIMSDMNTDKWSATDGGELTIQLNTNSVTYLQGKTATVTLTLSDGKTVKATTTF